MQNQAGDMLCSARRQPHDRGSCPWRNGQERDCGKGGLRKAHEVYQAAIKRAQRY